MVKWKLSKKAGFGLVEALVATSFLVVVMGALTYLMHYSLRATRSAGLRTVAYNLAQEKLETIYNDNRGQLPAETNQTCSNKTLNDIQFKICYTVTRQAPAGVDSERYRKIKVKVNWQEYHKNRELELLTYFTDVD